jgi:hypothetical protein
VRVLNGGTPDGADWHRRLLERLSIATDHRPALISPATASRLGEWLRSHHRVRQLDADDLDAEQVQRRLRLVLDLLPQVLADLQTFERWLVELAERAAGFSRRRQHRVERSRSFEAFGWCGLPILLRQRRP